MICFSFTPSYTMIKRNTCDSDEKKQNLYEVTFLGVILNEKKAAIKHLNAPSYIHSICIAIPNHVQRILTANILMTNNEIDNGPFKENVLFQKRTLNYRTESLHVHGEPSRKG